MSICYKKKLTVQGSRFMGSEFSVQSSEFRVQGSGFRVQSSGFKVQGSWVQGFMGSRVQHRRWPYKRPV
jgi:hypothetical protein